MSTSKYDNNPNLGIMELQPNSNEGDGVKNEEREKINVKNNPFLRQQAISLMTSKMTESDQVKLQRIRKKIKNIRRSLFRSELLELDAVVKSYITYQFKRLKNQEIAADTEIKLSGKIYGYPTDVLLFMSKITDDKIQRVVWGMVCNDETYPSLEKAEEALAFVLNRMMVK